MRNKILLLVALVGVALGIVAGPRFAAPAQAAVDSWSGKNEKILPYTGSITAGTAALVMSGVSGTRHNVRALTLTNTASGYVRIYRGTASSLPPIGSQMLAAYNVLANTPLTLDENALGPGLQCAEADAIYVDATTGTVSMTLRVREDPK